jgi:hypothetical protein
MQISISNTIKGQVSSGGGSSFENLYSFEFDGSTDYIDCGSSSYLQNLTQFSVSLWAKQTTATSTQCLISDWNFNTQGNIALETGAASGGATKLTFYIRINSATIRTTTTQNFVFTENVWNHIAITFNSGTLNIYVNGIAQGLNLPSLPTSLVHNDGTLDIGYFEGLGRYFSGYIDEVAIFNTELSSTDVTAIYNSGIPNDLTSLSPISWWRMGEAANYSGGKWTLTDQGSGGNNGFSATLPAPPTAPSTDVPT